MTYWTCCQPGCKTIIEDATYCPEHTVKRDRSMGVNRKVRNEVFARDRGKCTECGKTQAKAKAESRNGLQVHHIDLDPFNDDLANLRLLCVKCHGRVAAAARKQKLAESRYGRDLADRKKSGYERGLR